MAWDHDASRHARGYGYRWGKLRARILRDGIWCQPCLAAGRKTIATEVDHVLPKAKGGTDEASNLQSICHDCHKAKTQADAGNGKHRAAFDKAGRVVW